MLNIVEIYNCNEYKMLNLKNLLKYCIFYSQSFALIKNYAVLTSTCPEEREAKVYVYLPKSNKPFSLHI